MNNANNTFLSKYTTFIFDFDYTLADASTGIITCFQTILGRHNFKNISDEAIKYTIGMTLEDSFGKLTHIDDKDQLIRFRDEYMIEADKIMSDNTQLYPESIPLIEFLKKQGATIGIVSSKQAYIIRRSLVKYGIENLFDIVVGYENVTKAKPDPEGLKLAMRALNASVDKTLYIGDNVIDAQTAQSAGVDFVGVTTGTTTFDEFLAYPHRAIVSNLSQITAITESD